MRISLDECGGLCFQLLILLGTSVLLNWFMLFHHAGFAYQRGFRSIQTVFRKKHLLHFVRCRQKYQFVYINIYKIHLPSIASHLNVISVWEGWSYHGLSQKATFMLGSQKTLFIQGDYFLILTLNFETCVHVSWKRYQVCIIQVEVTGKSKARVFIGCACLFIANVFHEN